MEQEKARLQQQEEWQRSQKARAEQELASQKRRLQQYQGKLERLQQQMSILSSALGEYQQSMQVFQAAGSTAGAGHDAVCRQLHPMRGTLYAILLSKFDR